MVFEVELALLLMLELIDALGFGFIELIDLGLAMDLDFIELMGFVELEDLGAMDDIAPGCCGAVAC